MVLGGGGYVSFGDEVGDELVDLGGAHFFGVAFVVVEDVFAHPLDVGFAGAGGVLFGLDGVLILVEELFGCFLGVGLGEILFWHFVAPLAGVAYNLFCPYKVYYTEQFGITPRRGTKSRMVPLKRSWADNFKIES